LSTTREPERNGNSGPDVPPARGPGGGGALGRRDALVLACIVLAALAIRLIYILQYRSSPTFVEPVMDPQYHVEWARAFARGESFMAGEPYFRAPLYPWFLGMCFKLFGESMLVPRIVQALLGSLSCGLVFLIARRFFGSVTAAIAGAAAATYWLYVYFDAELLITTLVIFLDLGFLWLLVRADETRTVRGYMLAGFVMGLSAIARPNILLFGLAACVWIILRDHRNRRPAFARSFLFGLACLVPIIPITIRNAVEGDDLVLISSQGGVNFYIGNNAKADGTRAVVPGTRPDWWGGYHDTIAMAERDAGRELKPSEVSRYFFGKALEYIKGDFWSWLGLTGRKLRYYWNASEISNNQPIRFFAERYAPIVRYLPIGFGLIAPLGLMGLLLCFRRPGRFFPLWGFVAVYSATIIVFFVCTRFRIPVTGVLIILAAESVRWMAAAFRAGRWQPAASALLILAPLAWWINAKPAELIEPDFQGYTIIADCKNNANDADGAIACLKEGILAYPGCATLHVQLGALLVNKGDFDEAEQNLLAALDMKEFRARESYGTAGYWLGFIAANRGEEDKAIAFFRESIRHDPNLAATYYYLAFLLAKRNRLDEAVPLFERCLKLAPDFAEAHLDLGKALMLQGKRREALDHIRAAVRLNPANAQARRLLETLSSGAVKQP